MQPLPAKDYTEAVRRIEKLQTLDNDEVNPLSFTTFLTHGHKTGRAILLLHGYTSSPRMYVKFAAEFFERGYNVLIPRLPHHGLKDRMTTALENQTESELLAATRETIDIMQGLGEQVTVAGISMGGVLTLWAAQHRADVALACAISPALAYHAIPLGLTPLTIQAFLRLPNQFLWWDPKMKDTPAPPLHAYPRYATRGLAHLTNIGLKVRAISRHTQPLAGSVLVVTNPTDENVDNAYAHEIVANWQALGANQVRSYEFDPNLNLIHDLIEPEQANQKIDIVYPILLEQMTGQ